MFRFFGKGFFVSGSPSLWSPSPRWLAPLAAGLMECLVLPGRPALRFPVCWASARSAGSCCRVPRLSLRARPSVFSVPLACSFVPLGFHLADARCLSCVMPGVGSPSVLLPSRFVLAPPVGSPPLIFRGLCGVSVFARCSRAPGTQLLLRCLRVLSLAGGSSPRVFFAAFPPLPRFPPSLLALPSLTERAATCASVTRLWSLPPRVPYPPSCFGFLLSSPALLLFLLFSWAGSFCAALQLSWACSVSSVFSSSVPRRPCGVASFPFYPSFARCSFLLHCPFPPLVARLLERLAFFLCSSFRFLWAPLWAYLCRGVFPGFCFSAGSWRPRLVGFVFVFSPGCELVCCSCALFLLCLPSRSLSSSVFPACSAPVRLVLPAVFPFGLSHSMWYLAWALGLVSGALAYLPRMFIWLTCRFYACLLSPYWGSRACRPVVLFCCFAPAPVPPASLVLLPSCDPSSWCGRSPLLPLFFLRCPTPWWLSLLSCACYYGSGRWRFLQPSLSIPLLGSFLSSFLHFFLFRSPSAPCAVFTRSSMCPFPSFPPALSLRFGCAFTSTFIPMRPPLMSLLILCCTMARVFNLCLSWCPHSSFCWLPATWRFLPVAFSHCAFMLSFPLLP